MSDWGNTLVLILCHSVCPIQDTGIAVQIAAREASVTKVSTIGQTLAFLGTNMRPTGSYTLLYRRVPVLN